MSCPLVVLGAGQRCGSTLVQRLLSSHPDAFIWGEQDGHLEPVLAAVEALYDHNGSEGAGGRDEFSERGYQGFIANLMPEPAVMGEAFEKFCSHLFAADGTRVWGFKEVRYDRTFAERLQKFLPGVRVIFVVRDPRDVLRSLDEWERLQWWSRAETQRSIDHWQRIASSFLEPAAFPVLTLRYEDFTADPQSTAYQIGAFANLDPAGFDMSVFGRKVHNIAGAGPRELRQWCELPSALRALLFQGAVGETAAAYNYWLR